MIESIAYDNYPWRIIVLSNAVSLSIYGLGFAIMVQSGWIISFLYTAYILFFEYRLLSSHCIHCFYWGKRCGFGKGIVSSWIFKKGDSARFCAHEMSWKEMIPDLLISLVPFFTAIILLIIEFDYVLLISLILLTLLTTTGNGLVRGKLACPHCKQKELGCPAEALFNKNQNRPARISA